MCCPCSPDPVFRAKCGGGFSARTPIGGPRSWSGRCGVGGVARANCPRLYGGDPLVFITLSFFLRYAWGSLKQNRRPKASNINLCMPFNAFVKRWVFQMKTLFVGTPVPRRPSWALGMLARGPPGSPKFPAAPPFI